MKQFFLLISILFYFSCNEEERIKNVNLNTFNSGPAGNTMQVLTGNENNLPEKLKGLEIFYVKDQYDKTTRVGFFNKKPALSLTYDNGKFPDEVTIIVNPNSGDTIKITQILFENDSIVVARK